MDKHKTGILDLPGELRNNIYHYLLIEDHPISALNLKWSKDRTCRSYEPSHEPAIMLTCKTIRNEASSVYYGCNAFTLGRVSHLWIMSEATHQISRWLKHIGHGARYLREVDVAVNCEILGPRHAAYSLRDFWETLHLRVSADGSGCRASLTGIPTLDAICVCDLNRPRERNIGPVDVLLEASRRYFTTTELSECDVCQLPRLEEPTKVNDSVCIA